MLCDYKLNKKEKEGWMIWIRWDSLTLGYCHTSKLVRNFDAKNETSHGKFILYSKYFWFKNLSIFFYLFIYCIHVYVFLWVCGYKFVCNWKEAPYCQLVFFTLILIFIKNFITWIFINNFLIFLLISKKKIYFFK